LPLRLPLVLATQNADKAREIAEIFAAEHGAPLAVQSLAGIAYVVDAPASVARAASALPVPPAPPDVAETGDTLEENARIKARAVARAFGTLAVADDTGLEVDALDGAPGVHSARYAGPSASYSDNVAKLLRALEGVTPARRTARFATVAVARGPDGLELVARGEVAGVIAPAPRGAGGFGYDPVFAPTEGDGRTFGEMTAAEKHAISHRGRAFRALAAALGRRD
jgi:XTP/dITP diphosphohydrolase